MAKRGAKRTARPAAKKAKAKGKTRGSRRSGGRQKPAKRSASSRGGKAKAAKRKSRPVGKARAAQPSRPRGKSRPPRKAAAKPSARKAPRLDRARRTLEEGDVPTPPSSLNMDRHGSAVRTGRAEMLDNQRKHGKMNAVTAGDVDVDAEDAYFTGEEAPGGDNPTPDQDVVDDIGKALGLEYQDDDELKASDKVAERDKHRWELDPASSEDYKGRK